MEDGIGWNEIIAAVVTVVLMAILITEGAAEDAFLISTGVGGWLWVALTWLERQRG